MTTEVCSQTSAAVQYTGSHTQAHNIHNTDCISNSVILRNNFISLLSVRECLHTNEKDGVPHWKP